MRRLPVWWTGAAMVAAGLVIVAPGTASACGGQTGLASGGAGLPAAGSAGISAVQVTGGGPVSVPAGGAASFGVTVANTGGRFGGSIELEVRTSGPSSIPALTVELAGSRGDTKTWTRLAEEGTPGARWFAAAGLSFQSGESSTEFRLGVPPDAVGKRLRITAHVRDTAGRQVGAAIFDVTVTDAAVRVRSTFPAELRRGAGYREFDVEVRNRSTRTYHDVRASLSFTGLTGVPIPREAGHLSDADIRLERRSGGTWQRLAVHPGCDPVYSAALGEPFDLEAGGSRTLHLRIRLADSPATIPHPAQYYLGAGPAGNPDALSILSENFLIRPRQNSGTGPAGRPAPTHGDGPASAATAPAAHPAAPTPPAAAPASLPHTGAPIWPLAGGIALLLGGTGALVAARRRHMGRR
jgi:LPXTG-motif cell wall-anchored protein